MASGTTRKTRRSSRQVVLDELDLVMRRLEQIKNMVDKHCVAPPTTAASAARQKAEILPPQLTPVEEAEAEAEVKSILGNSESQLEKARSLQAKRNMPVSVSSPTSRKRKSGGCPGGPEAYNKFVKEWLSEQRAAGREITHQQALKEIKETGIYEKSCGLPPKKNVTRKAVKSIKTAVTPGRVNAVISPRVAEETNATPQALEEERNATPQAANATPQALEEERNATPQAANATPQAANATPQAANATPQAANATPQAANATPQASNATPQASNATPQASNATPQASNAQTEENKGYEDLGMDDTTGMRRIKANGRDLYMTNGNSGLFERNGNAPGDFVGYLREGKIEPASPPEL
jgi:hypothetical protein